MEHSNRRRLPSILIMTMPFASFAVGAATPPHHEVHMGSDQFKIEIAASRQQLISAVEQFTQASEQQMETYMQAQTKRFERYHARQLEMSKDIKEILRREGL
ncbi:hypothetical protein ACEQ2R_003348 [Vibrio parahaemolyticus]|uniref:hypothetical protein n=1 Tax=Vibrio parahaemolyticus TaxID=670 RepID=UPI0004706675|nr:hypothetical protein [Vibrio parahaemolyticus]EGR3455229.1 hypothetical protein [Vibrio parahaemolyticus]EJO3863225.1 hypothetical protein [Vibrio parahaemolyticus]ELA7933312.1 hypothetical protein [Vibrio parahaemolyticus]ELB2263790.1 hypothetical protein [Vibrio parahaemolyticus]MQC29986.1 hypothetical protein [Vibrio parahaemolyticus]